MKKRNFITGFSAAFVATIALVSCGGVRAKDGVYLIVNGKEYYAKDLYIDQKTPAAAEAKFNAVYKLAVRRHFQSGQEGSSDMPEITRNTKLKVAGAKEEAKTNSDRNHTKYKEEWEKILSSNGVDDEQGLYDKFEYDLMKTKFEDTIYDRKFDNFTKGESNYDVLRNGGYLKNNKGEDVDTKGEKIPGYLENKFPYHMKHILVKISAKENDDISGEITAAEAEKICLIINKLANGTSFDEIASSTLNDDETARKNHGSLGIMSTDTEFVNDFKLGTYLFDAFYGACTKSGSGGTCEPKNAKELLFNRSGYEKSGTYADKITKLDDPTAADTTEGVAKIGRIPYGSIDHLFDVRDNVPLYSMDLTNGDTAARFAGVTDVKARYYPRNIIFNKYFNKHNISVITNAERPTIKYNYETASDDYIKRNKQTSEISKGVAKDTYYDNATGAKITAEAGEGVAGFKSSGNIKNKNDVGAFLGTLEGTQENVLCDENGRIILVFRSGSGTKSSNDSTGYQGIHFVVIERSPFFNKEFEDEASNKYTTLEEYYTQYYPMEGGYHPTYDDKKNKKTFVNYFVGAETSDLKARADTVKAELKKTDANLNTFVYEYLMKKGEIVFNQASEQARKLEDSISKWIQFTKRGDNKKSSARKWNDTWETYYNNLELRAENRQYVNNKGEKIAPEVLLDVFAGKETLKYTITEGESTITVPYLLSQVFGKGGAYND